MYGTTIIDSSLPFAWVRALEFVLNSTEKISFGGGKEIKHATDSQTTIILDSHAVGEALAGITHPLDPFCTPLKLPMYKQEYTEDYPHNKHDYTYYDRLKRGFYRTNANTPAESFLDQIVILRNGLQQQVNEGLSSNRNVGILFNPVIENFSGKSTPCWNEVLIRWIGGRKVSVHTTFRSHDLWGAWESNMVSILDFINRDIVQPCGCSIAWVQEVNYSLHIHDADFDAATRTVKESKIARRADLWMRQANNNYIAAGGILNA